MGTAIVSDGGGEGSDGKSVDGWQAEKAVAGNRRALEALRELVAYPFLYARESRLLGLKWPRGLLLHGPPGTGKTSLVRAIVRECNAHLTTIKIDAVDPALRRAGRFDSEVEVAVPTVEERLLILKLYTKNLHLDEKVDLQTVAAFCNGYVGADLEALCREAAKLAYHRMLNLCEGDKVLKLLMEDWECARSMVGPSITRGVTKEISIVSWDDIGGLKDLKVRHFLFWLPSGKKPVLMVIVHVLQKELQKVVEWPIKHAAAFSRLGIPPVRGVLLHGPPGCSKTTLAKAAAHAAQASFFSLSGADLYSKYVGEGEALLRRTFQKARLASPSIIFFDEADAIAPKRTGPGGNSSGNATVGERLLSTLLTEMDGLELATGIIVLGATNRPNAIDAALLRPGRFDKVLYVPPPDVEGRHEILRIHTRKMKLGEDVDLWKVAECTELFTGADLEGLCREAGMAALREDISASLIHDAHFQAARSSLSPSLTKAVVDEYSKVDINDPSSRKH
ncbi:Cell division control protein 48 homolog B [Zea mays]|uniref:Cell division control protein 48 homolog B n=1 Tax=Zea mays TaxID=4577 RepID=A0A1D6J9G0_MAIZE|nr:Cell division control protein 48 homolog B [Zea mays]AQK44555.1 Cell division control protein 48 homolog B [Zea mays]